MKNRFITIFLAVVLVSSVASAQWLNVDAVKPELKTWENLQKLLKEVCSMSDHSSDICLTRFAGGKYWISIDDGLSKITGEGRDPWEAAANLASKSNTIANRLRLILGAGS